MKYIYVIILFVSLLNSAYAADIQVNIQGIEKNDGMIRVALFPSAIKEMFPVPNKAIQKSIKADTNGVSLKFMNVPSGEYAISVLHDKNSNHKMDMFLGIPAEPHGNSGKYTNFKPSYEKSKFTVTDKNIVIEIGIH